ncbi:MAG: helix-hairpin-helix domain-containing protein [Acidobacteriaceae bacterium]
MANPHKGGGPVNPPKSRKLEDLVSVGPAIRRDFSMLGIHSVAEVARQEPEALYRKLCRKTKTKQDICVLDTFRAAIEQARDPDLPPEKCVWWYWSRMRKSQKS